MNHRFGNGRPLPPKSRPYIGSPIGLCRVHNQTPAVNRPNNGINVYSQYLTLIETDVRDHS